MSETYAICKRPRRKKMEAVLGSDGWRLPNRIARMFASISRAQVRRHRAMCPFGSPRVTREKRTELLSEQEFADHLKEKGETGEATEIAGVAWRLLEEAG